jgi:hypothetical protein
MSISKKIALGLLAWAGVISALHLSLNLDWSALLNDQLEEGERKLNVAYIPVT